MSVSSTFLEALVRKIQKLVSTIVSRQILMDCNLPGLRSLAGALARSLRRSRHKAQRRGHGLASVNSSRF